MSTSDPLDGRIREALAELVSRAPLASEIEELGPPPVGSRRRGLLLASAVALVGVVLGAVALARGGDTTVDTSSADRQPDSADTIVAPCLERRTEFPDPNTDVVVYLQPDASPELRDAALAALSSLPSVQLLRSWTQDEVYGEFRQLFADSPQTLESATPDKFPPRVELAVSGDSSVDVVMTMIDVQPAVRATLTVEDAVENLEQLCKRPVDGGATQGAEVADVAAAGDEAGSEGVPPNEVQVSVFFPESESSDYTNFNSYIAVPRIVALDGPLNGDSTEGRAAGALRALAAGPTATESAQGVSNYFPSDPELIRSVSFSGGTLVIDFRPEIVGSTSVGTDGAGVEMMASLMATVFQFDEVKILELHGDGSCSTFAKWAGFEGDCVRRTREEVEVWKATPRSTNIAPTSPAPPLEETIPPPRASEAPGVPADSAPQPSEPGEATETGN